MSAFHRTIVVMLLLLTKCVSSPGEIHRFSLFIGANCGGPDRVTLRYAVSDAHRIADIFTSMGGVNKSDCIILEEPSPIKITEAIERLATAVNLANESKMRTEMIVYYSGHADENGLSLKNQSYTYTDLRSMLRSVKTDLTITILDACASGSITRIKGTTRKKPFLTDAISEMKGYAFLTSSSEDETAQESDKIKGSFFTHYLVCGLRGAADMSGDGRVTLNEAYQFAYQETLAKTAKTGSNPQHAACDIKLVGTGEIVMTDFLNTSGILRFDPAISGKIFVFNEEQQLTAELFKLNGKHAAIGLKPGPYEVYVQRNSNFGSSTVNIPATGQTILSEKDIHHVAKDQTLIRGLTDPKAGFSSRPFSFGIRYGFMQFSAATAAIEAASAIQVRSSYIPPLALWMEYRLTDKILVGALYKILCSESNTVVGSATINAGNSLVDLFTIGGRYDITHRRAVTPFALLSLGVCRGTNTNRAQLNFTNAQVGTGSEKSFSVTCGLGAVFSLLWGFELNTIAAYNGMSDFNNTVCSRKNFSGLDLGVGLSIGIGRSRYYQAK